MTFKTCRQSIRMAADLKLLLANRSEETGLSENTLLNLALRAYLTEGNANQLHAIAGQLIQIADDLAQQGTVQPKPPYVLPVKADTESEQPIKHTELDLSQVVLTPNELNAIAVTESQGQVQPLTVSETLKLYPDYDSMLLAYYNLTPTDPYPEDWCYIRDIVADDDPELASKYPDSCFDYEEGSNDLTAFANIIELMTTAYQGCSLPLDFRKSRRQLTYKARVKAAIDRAKEAKVNLETITV